eukprot:6127842-Prymnesium_polylepis.2
MAAGLCLLRDCAHHNRTWVVVYVAGRMDVNGREGITPSTANPRTRQPVWRVWRETAANYSRTVRCASCRRCGGWCTVELVHPHPAQVDCAL